MSDEAHALTLEETFDLDDPLDISDAREAARTAATNRRRVRDELERQVKVASDAEGAYDRKLAATMVALRDQEPPTPTTILKEVARGDDDVIAARRKRDIEFGRLDLLKRELNGIEGERAMLRQLIEMSQRLRVEAGRVDR